jgi:hypothetical protein
MLSPRHLRRNANSRMMNSGGLDPPGLYLLLDGGRSFAIASAADAASLRPRTAVK